jgi:hypothetical protein
MVFAGKYFPNVVMLMSHAVVIFSVCYVVKDFKNRFASGFELKISD